jgi:glycosyltransferase involved in cell wall biosynthesis
MRKVLLCTNIPAPYRLPVFAQLAQRLDLYVLFAQGDTPERYWQLSLEPSTFQYAILTHVTLQLGQVRLVVNPGLWRWLRQQKFDVAIWGDNRQTLLSGWCLYLAARLYHRPFIIWSGATPGDTISARSHPLWQRGYARCWRWLMRRATAIVAYGSATRQHLIQQGITADKVFMGTQVMPLTLLPQPTADRTVLGVAGKQVVLSVNYFLPRKGLSVLIAAFQQVAQADDVLVLVGDGPERESLQRLAAGDGRIRFPGYQDGAAKTAWYAAADIFVLPTLHDPWGLVVNEAMAFGLPIITTSAAGCTPDLVQDNGRVVPAEDVQALAAALADLLADPVLRQQMGERSRTLIADYTVERVCTTFLHAIRYALEQPCLSS